MTQPLLTFLCCFIVLNRGWQIPPSRRSVVPVFRANLLFIFALSWHGWSPQKWGRIPVLPLLLAAVGLVFRFSGCLTVPFFPSNRSRSIRKFALSRFIATLILRILLILLVIVVSRSSNHFFPFLFSVGVNAGRCSSIDPLTPLWYLKPKSHLKSKSQA